MLVLELPCPWCRLGGSCADPGAEPAPCLLLCPALSDAQKLQSRRRPGPGFSVMKDAMCEQIQRLGLLYPSDSSCIRFLLRKRGREAARLGSYAKFTKLGWFCSSGIRQLPT